MTQSRLPIIMPILLLSAGCVVYQQPRTSAASQNSVESAKQMIHDVSDLNLMPPVYRDCSVDAPAIEGVSVDGQQRVVARAGQRCEGAVIRKDGVNRPVGQSDPEEK